MIQEYIIYILEELKLWWKRLYNIQPYTFKKRPTYLASPKVRDWRSREKKVVSQEDPKPSYKLQDIREINWWVNRNIEYVTDQENWDMIDYWPDSDETLQRGQEDCDGQAILKWRMMKDLGVPDDQIGLIIVPGHMFACYYEDPKSNDFWILDNGNIVYTMHKASKVIPYSDKKLKWGFNLDSEWLYKE